MNPLQPFWDAKQIAVLDGGLATELERGGEDLQDELWSAKILIHNPQHIKQVHRSYLKAGADIITTSSYQATFEGFQHKGLSESESERLMQLSSQLALESRDEFWEHYQNSAPTNSPPHYQRVKPLVAASIGCYGASLHDGSEFRGDYASKFTIDQFKDFHRRRLACLLSTGVDLVAFETLPCMKEAEAIIQLLGEFKNTHNNAYGWISFSCKDSQHVSNGDLWAKCVELANQSDQIVAVGINCTAPKLISGLVTSIPVSLTTKPLLVYPNRGETWDFKTGTWQQGKHNEEPNLYQYAQTWKQQGVKLIGGCCRTTPDDIAVILKAVK